MLSFMKSSKDTSSNTPFLSAAKITFYSFLPPLILRIWTEIHLLESISWEQQAWSTPLAWRRSAQTVIPWQSSFQPKPNVQPAYKKKFLFTSSCNTKSVPRRRGNFRKKNTKQPTKIDCWNLFRLTPVGLSQREGNFLCAKCLPPLQ